MTSGKLNWKIGSPNKSGVYVLPMLGDSIDDFRSDNLPPTNLFRNCFIGDIQLPEKNNHIFLLYKYHGHRKFQEFDEVMQRHPLFDCMYDPDKLHVMYIFNVPEYFQEDYDKFKEGRYSEFSEEYKEHLTVFHGWDLRDHSKNQHPVIATLYRLPAGYENTEKHLNGNIKPGEAGYITIPRNQECSSKPELDAGKELRFVEIYQPLYKVPDKIAMAREATAGDQNNQ